MKLCWTIAALSLLPLSGTSLDDYLIGKASVIECDTLEIYATRIGLWGIDASERDQFCRARDSL
jgi:endonuclease YncB( thermonuclease family)